MPHLLHLTKSEQKKFAQFPDALRKGCEVKEETEDGLEDDMALYVRANMASFSKNASLKALLQKIKDGNIDAAEMGKLDAKILPEFFFTIGARGMNLLIEGMLLDSFESDDALATLSALTVTRHEILETNRSIHCA